MNIVVQKSEEDAYLNYCDGTCSNSDECVIKKQLGVNVAGTAMKYHGFKKCVLCYRYMKNKPYSLFPDNYPYDCFDENGNVVFSPDDYTVIDGRCIIQTFKNNIDVHQESTICIAYKSEIINVEDEYILWVLCICNNDNCKLDILTSLNTYRSIGISHTYFDLEEECVKCVKCNHKVKYINSDKNGIVNHNGNNYVQCRFCKTCIIYDYNKIVQICTKCTENTLNEAKISSTVCVYCGNSINKSKKNGVQSFNVKNGSHIKIFHLCKHHRLKKHTNCLKMNIELSEFKELLEANNTMPMGDFY